MDSTLNKENMVKVFLRKYHSYLTIIIVAALLEAVIGNYSAFRSALCKQITMAENMQMDEDGVFRTNVYPINQDVKNIYIDLELENCEEAEVTVSISDEGDTYPYDIPSFYVVPSERSTHYTNLYPFGEIKDIQISVSVPEWAKADNIKIIANNPKPFSFKWIRFLIVAIISCSILMVWNERIIYQIYCKRKSRQQFIVILCTLAIMIVMGGFLVRSNPESVRSPWRHQHQYQELAKAISEGTIALPIEPDERLLNAPNPYDTIALQMEDIPFQMDHAYFEGKYYVYFGIIPEVLFYLPYFLLTGHDLPNYMAMFAFYSAFCIGIFGLIWELIHKYGNKVPFFQYILLSVSICGGINYIFMAARPDLYNIPIMAANCFVVWGIFLWLKGIASEHRKSLWYFSGSLSMAMVAGCRPQMLLFSLIGVVLFWDEIRNKRKLFSKKSWKETILICMPYLLIGILVFWYNAARFGSGFDFGATYSLTSNDMNHRGFNLSRVSQGLFSFFVQPATIKSSFPFIFSSRLDSVYMGKNMTEFTFGGIFASNSLLSVIIYWLCIRKQKFKGERKWLAWVMCICSFIIAVFDVNGAGILQRYMSDMIFGFTFTAALMWITLLSHHDENNDFRVWSRVFYMLVLCGLFYSFFAVFAKGDTVCLQNDNSVLFYKVASYFKF